MKKSRKYFVAGGIFLALFAALTLFLMMIDFKGYTQALHFTSYRPWDFSQCESFGDFSFVLSLHLYKPNWYEITEILGMIPFLAVALFAGMGLGQWVRRKSLKNVDKDLFFLAGLYACAAAAYVVFELFVVNYRPNELEASYPSSHTVLGCVILLSTALQIRSRVKHRTGRTVGQAVCWLLAAILSFGRLLAGVHWWTDVLGGILISVALVFFYRGVVCFFDGRKSAQTGI